MPEVALVSTPPFAVTPGRYGRETETAGLCIRPIKERSVVQVLARRGQEAELAQVAKGRFGATLPGTPQVAIGRDVLFLWAGRAQWLAMANETAVPSLEARLRGVFSGMASLCDQSDARCIVDLSGTNVRDTLAKMTPIDLHPRAFRPGQTALTLFDHLNGQITQFDESPSYEVMVFRGFAESLLSSILTAGGEFGIEIVNPSELRT